MARFMTASFRGLGSLVVLGFVHLQLSVPANAQDKVKGPVKVFLLMGQSNMNGRGNIKVLREKLTINLPKLYPPSLMKMRNDVWIASANGWGISDQKTNLRLEPGFGQWKWFGPELGFGHVMGDHFKEQVLLIKVFAGGTPLATVWSSPTAAKRTGRPLGKGYMSILRKTTAAIHHLDELFEGYDKKKGYQIMGMVWVHGNADGGKYSREYEDNLTDFVVDVRASLGIPKLPVVLVESLSSRAPGIAFKNAAERVNKLAGNQQAMSIVTKKRINLRDETYGPYKGAGDSTHWLHNPRAFLDVGYWSAKDLIPKLAGPVNHAADDNMQAHWAKQLAEFDKLSPTS